MRLAGVQAASGLQTSARWCLWLLLQARKLHDFQYVSSIEPGAVAGYQ